MQECERSVDDSYRQCSKKLSSCLKYAPKGILTKLQVIGAYLKHDPLL